MKRRRLLAVASLVCAAACSGARSGGPALSSDELVALNNRGVGLMGQFDFGQARDTFRRLASAYPDQLDLQVNFAIATLNRQQEGDSAEARRTLEHVLTVDAAHVRAHYNLGLLLVHDGHAQEALPHFQFVVEHDPSDAYAWYYIGQCRAQQADVAGALVAYERALTTNPRLRSAAYGAFQSMQRLGRADTPQMRDRFTALETNPQSEVAEFKYTRLGPLGEATTVDQPVNPARPARPARPASPARPARARTPRPAGPVFSPAMPIRISPVSEGIAWRSIHSSITAADIDGDGAIDLFIAGAIEDRGVTRNAVLLNRGAEGFVLDRSHPLAAVTDVQAALWGDYDNDGFVDVYLCRKGANQLWRQTERGRWANVTAAARAGGGGGSTIDGVMFDADHDGDLDLLLIKATGANELLSNNGDGTFRSIGATTGLSADRRPSAGVVIADLDADRDADIITIGAAAPHGVFINDRAWHYHHDPAFDAFARAPITAAVAGDLDADGRPEIYTSDSSGIRRWTREASGAWEPRVIAGTESLANASQLALTDLDGDGRLELVGTTTDGRWEAVAVSADGNATAVFTADGPPLAAWSVVALDPSRGPSIVGMPAGNTGPPVVWTPGAGRFPFVALSLSGRDPRSQQIRSNSSGIGTQVAARAGSQWTALSTYRAQSGAGQSLQPIMLGLGGQPQIDFIAMTWSDGVFQSELALAPGRTRFIGETQRQLSSCPVLFAFDGMRFAFVTDVLGVGGIGTPTAPGVYGTPRPRENILLPEGLVTQRQGRYAIKIAEPMEEVAYIDAARLVTYDVPPGWQMVLDERLASSAPEATGERRFYRDERVPSHATDETGQDVTAAIVTADGIAAPPGRIDRRHIGRTDEHVLTLTFDRRLPGSESGVKGQSPAMLVADGWIEYPYAQTLFAAWQSAAPYRAPTIEARGGDGQWRVLRRDFGYPAGMPRRISVPLGRLPSGADAIRLTTTQEIYWDRLSIAFAEEAPAVSAQVLPLVSASLARTGFERQEMHTGRRPSYDYDRRTPFDDMRYPRGNYTAEGPVTELLAAEDGAVTVLGPGEEIHLEFAAEQAAPAPGWTRRFVVELRGWCKDMDLYTRDGDTVEPLPGSRGPAAEGLQRRYTTRYQSGR